MTNLVHKSALTVEKPKAGFKKGFDLRTFTKEIKGDNGAVKAYEFIGTDNFGSRFYERQRYEVDAGRDIEPLLYTSLYDEVSDPNLPRSVTIDRIGPGAVIFDDVTESGEVKFSTVGGSTDTVQMRHLAAGLEYTKDLVVYNELWNLAIVERQAGIAYNAALNEMHLSPFIDYAYAAANQTPASSVGTLLVEKYLRTLEDGVTNGRNDATNPRRGPFVLLMSTSNMFTMERALKSVPQQGFDIQSSVGGRISAIIGYDGWSGMRGKKAVTYAGVTANKAYLIDVSNKFRYLRSFIKQDLEMAMGNPDVSRFILDQIVWDTYRTHFADIAATTEELTLPTS